MNTKNTVLGVVALSMFALSSCKDDDVTPIKKPVVITAPATYTFERNGASNVSFGGQTTRIKMAGEFASALKDNTLTEQQLDAMFNHAAGESDFSDADLNTANKSIRSKVAASQDFFSANSTDANAIKADFDNWIIVHERI